MTETSISPTPVTGVNGSAPALAPRADYPIADFYTTITFDWNEDDLEVTEAVEKFCETAYADR